MGLRERKKAHMRQKIIEAAWHLFADRGFDRVTVAAIAERAEVAPATVFNYFPTKEDLFLSGLDAYVEQMIKTVAQRDKGETVQSALQRYLLESEGLLPLIERGDEVALERLRTMNRVIAESPALQAHEHRVLDRHTAALTELIVEETGDDRVTTQVVAIALMGVHRALLDLVRRRVLADDRPEALAADVRTHAARAFARLDQGLGGYSAR